jgi:hypothetical protein
MCQGVLKVLSSRGTSTTARREDTRAVEQNAFGLYGVPDPDAAAVSEEVPDTMLEFSLLLPRVLVLACRR